MKALKASKKLITSVICFALSLVLCVGVCLAWFAVNKKVESDGAKVGVRNSDIVRFNVTVHYLNGVTGGYGLASTGNVAGAGNVDINGDGVLVSEDSMRPYGGLVTFTTAVLFEIDYEIVTSDKNYRIYASCPEDNAFTVEPLDEEKNNFESALSNTVGFYLNVGVDGEVFSKADKSAETFIKDDNGKRNVIMLKEKIVPSAADAETGNYVGKTYVIMDYMPESFIYLSSLMIGAGGSLQSKLSMAGDLTVNIEVYDPENPDNPAIPDNPDDVKVTGVSLNKTTATIKKGETATLAATIEPANATDKALTWASSNESVATVSGGVVTAVGAGKATITATAKDGGFTAECEVTVTEETGGTNKFTWTAFTKEQISSGSSVSDSNGVITFKQTVETRNSVEKATTITELGLTTTEFSVGKAFELIAGEEDLTVTLYLCGTNSTGSSVNDVAITIAGATSIEAVSGSTISNGVANVSGTYGVITVKISKGTTCSFTPDGTRRLGVYAIVVEH